MGLMFLQWHCHAGLVRRWADGIQGDGFRVFARNDIGSGSQREFTPHVAGRG